MVRAVFERSGAPASHALVVAEHLVGANRAGHDSHGVMRVPQYVQAIEKGDLLPAAAPEVEKETASYAVVNGRWGFGQVAAKFAAELAIEKAGAASVACVVAHDLGHIGRLGAYTEMAAREGMIGIAMVNNHGAARLVAPFGGIDRRLSPNPISMCAPAQSDVPILVDASMSAVAEGKVRVKMKRGEPVPEGCIVDGNGNPTTDPAALYGPPLGSLLTFGGPFAHKTFGLSLMVECLAGALSGAGCSRPDATRIGNATFLLALNIEAFLPLDAFKRHVTDLVAYLKSSRKAPGVTEILVPGEPEARARETCAREGIYVADITWREITDVADRLGVDVVGR